MPATAAGARSKRVNDVAISRLKQDEVDNDDIDNDVCVRGFINLNCQKSFLANHCAYVNNHHVTRSHPVMGNSRKRLVSAFIMPL